VCHTCASLLLAAFPPRCQVRSTDTEWSVDWLRCGSRDYGAAISVASAGASASWCNACVALVPSVRSLLRVAARAYERWAARPVTICAACTPPSPRAAARGEATSSCCSPGPDPEKRVTVGVAGGRGPPRPAIEACAALLRRRPRARGARAAISEHGAARSSRSWLRRRELSKHAMRAPL